MGPRYLYLHGFASSPASAKGTALAAHFERRGARLERLDLRVPSAERPLLSAMMATTRAAIGGERDRAIVLGSSLGALTAARVAEEEPRVCALVLLAPAFRLIERWRGRPGAEQHADLLADAAPIEARGGGWPDVRVPTVVIHGRGDDVVPVEGSRAWAAGKRHVRLVEVDDGHELVASLPVIAAEIDAFLFR